MTRAFAEPEWALYRVTRRPQAVPTRPRTRDVLVWPVYVRPQPWYRRRTPWTDCLVILLAIAALVSLVLYAGGHFQLL